MHASTEATATPDQKTTRILRSFAPEKKLPAVNLAGEYRVIHGGIDVPRSWDEWHTPNGDEIEDAPRTRRATIHGVKFAIADDLANGICKGDPLEFVGDELFLTHEEATRLLAASLVEPIDTKPSRCGKVWQPPKPQPAV